MFQELLDWFDPPKIIGACFAVGTLGYILILTIIHHKDFWQGIKGEDGELNFLEAALTVWLVLFSSMVVADFAFGLVASDKIMWSMDSVFLVGVGGRTVHVMNRDKKKKNEDKKEDSGTIN